MQLGDGGEKINNLLNLNNVTLVTAIKISIGNMNEYLHLFFSA